LSDAVRKLELAQDAKTSTEQRGKFGTEADADVAMVLGELHVTEPD
jgi:hypothetical protein